MRLADLGGAASARKTRRDDHLCYAAFVPPRCHHGILRSFTSGQADGHQNWRQGLAQDSAGDGNLPDAHALNKQSLFKGRLRAQWPPPAVIITSTISHQPRMAQPLSAAAQLAARLVERADRAPSSRSSLCRSGMPSVMRGVRRMVMCAPGTPSVSDTPDLLEIDAPERGPDALLKTETHDSSPSLKTQQSPSLKIQQNGLRHACQKLPIG